MRVPADKQPAFILYDLVFNTDGVPARVTAYMTQEYSHFFAGKKKVFRVQLLNAVVVC